MRSNRSTKAGQAGRYLVLVTAFVLASGLLAVPAGAVTGPFVTFQKVATDATIEAGDVAGFTISGTNIGGATAPNVVVTDVLPHGGLAWAENPDVAACSIADDPGGDILTCNVGNLAVGASFSVTVQATTDPAVCDYTLSNSAILFVNGIARKQASASISVACKPSDGCTFTIGFWKTHYPDAWPVSSLTLGSVTYTAAQLEDIFNTPPAGNGLIILAHQLIGAKLNIAAGADPSAIAQAIADADALIDGLVVPPVGSGVLAPADTDALTTALDDYNNGVTGPGHCDEEEE